MEPATKSQSLPRKRLRASELYKLEGDGLMLEIRSAEGNCW